ncbi:MAG: ABC transporter permease subunit [Pyrinomonadaceae bacterium]|nr:ABC transporter permease subunit [Phycisphaerales bacterium]
MLSYIIRRLLVMIPTLIGITFIVFMMLAASPGGIGAGLKVSGGGQMQSTSSASLQQAKIEDRYGLNEPPLVQYVRWLGRVSPVKLGQRDLVSPAGALIVRPRPMPESAVWQWVTDKPDKPDSTLQERATAEINALGTKAAEAAAASDPTLSPQQKKAISVAAKAEEFRGIERAYVEARAAFTRDDTFLRDRLNSYAEAIRRPDLIGRDRKPNVKMLAAMKPDTSVPEYAAVETLAKDALASRKAAMDARERLIGSMAATPYDPAGVWIIPGALHIAWPDLGVAFSRNQPVIKLVKEHLPVTLLLNIIAFPIIYFIAIPSGLLAASRKGSWADVGLGSLYIGLYSIPVVLAGILAVGFLTTPDYFNWFPTSGLHDKEADGMKFLPSYSPDDGSWQCGWLLDLFWHIALPVACLVYGGFAILSKQTRAAMLENFSADYVRTAKAKGVSPRGVVLTHVFRNSLLPLITIFVTIFPAMLAGSVVVERIFTIPGMGYLVIESITNRDREMILGNTVMIAVVNLLALLMADIMYAMADPRISYK